MSSIFTHILRSRVKTTVSGKSILTNLLEFHFRDNMKSYLSLKYKVKFLMVPIHFTSKTCLQDADTAQCQHAYLDCRKPWDQPNSTEENVFISLNAKFFNEF